jgi:ATP:ADP antiporter, AAA family
VGRFAKVGAPTGSHLAISAPFGLRSGEVRPVLLLFGGSALLGAFAVFLSSTAGAIFLDAFGAGALPFLYVGAALLVATAGLIYARLESRVPVNRLLPGTLGTLLAGTLAIRLALALGATSGPGGEAGETRWAVVLLAGFGELAASFAPLTFWAMAGRLFDVRQAKRLFGPIGAGEVAATSAAGFALPFIVGRLARPTSCGCARWRRVG